jgi:hypothetical protein
VYFYVFVKYFSPSYSARIARSDEWDNMATHIDQNYEINLVVVVVAVVVADIDLCAMIIV